jgi:hypothetical protein
MHRVIFYSKIFLKGDDFSISAFGDDEEFQVETHETLKKNL